MDVMGLRRRLLENNKLKLVNYTTSNTTGQGSYSEIVIISPHAFRVYTSYNGTYPASRQNISDTPFAVGKTYILKGHIYTEEKNADVLLGFRNSSNTFMSSIRFTANGVGHDTDFMYEFTVANTFAYLSLCKLAKGSQSFDAILSNLYAYEIMD